MYMKKTILFLSIVLLSITVFAQKKEKTDTTKKNDPPAQVVQQHDPGKQLYFLVGPLDQFVLLLRSLAQHDDVTPNQIKALADWVNTKAQPVPADTTGKKK